MAYHIKKLFFIVLISLLSIATATADWRKQGSADQKINKLVKVIPGASEIMLQVGERYKNMYWAAKQGKWEFAGYQAEELESLIKKLQITRPKRANTAGEFLSSVYPDIEKATTGRSWKTFESAFDSMRKQCMICHVKNDHAFIKLEKPKTASSPVLNMD